jgi:hypothetical protein
MGGHETPENHPLTILKGFSTVSEGFNYLIVNSKLRWELVFLWVVDTLYHISYSLYLRKANLSLGLYTRGLCHQICDFFRERLSFL